MKKSKNVLPYCCAVYVPTIYRYFVGHPWIYNFYLPLTNSWADLTSPSLCKYSIKDLRNSSWDTVSLSPITARCLLALVTATLILRFSERKPTSPMKRYIHKWARAKQNKKNDLWAQRSLRSAWAFAQSDQSSLSAWRKSGSLAIHKAHSEGSHRTGQHSIKDLRNSSWDTISLSTITARCLLALVTATLILCFYDRKQPHIWEDTFINIHKNSEEGQGKGQGHKLSPVLGHRIWRTVMLNKPCHEKTCLMAYANNKGSDQPAHLHSLISALNVPCLDSISVVAISEISRLCIVSVAIRADWFESYQVENSQRQVFSWCGSDMNKVCLSYVLWIMNSISRVDASLNVDRNMNKEMERQLDGKLNTYITPC